MSNLPLTTYNPIFNDFSLLNQTGQPQVGGFTHTNAGYQNVVVQGNYAYVCGTGGNSSGVIGLTLSIFNVGDSANPFLVGYITTGTVPWVSGASYLNGSYSIAVNGRYLYVASSGSSYFYVVDISNPALPTNVGRLLITNTPGSIYGVAYQGGYCYCATQNKGLTVVDVRIPTAPVQVYQESGAVKSFGIAVFGPLLLTTQYSTSAPFTIRQIKSWDIKNPSAPTLLQSLQVTSVGESLGVSLYGSTAFVSVQAAGSYNTDIIDVTNPSSMSDIAQIASANSFNSAFTASANNNVLYIPSGSNVTYGGSIDMYDITHKNAPIHKGQVKTNTVNSVFGNICISNGYIYAADYTTAPSYNAKLDIFTQYNNTFSRLV